MATALVGLALAGCGGGKSAPSVRGAAPTLRNGDGAEYLAHEVIIRVEAGVTADALARALAVVGGKVIDDGGPLGVLGFRRVQLPVSITADVAISKLIDTGAIKKAEPNYMVQASATPNDARFGELWGMTKISAPAAWDITTGSKEVLVAVSDTGIDYNHADLSANVWTNPGEIAGNGKDDDGNGYVDDVHGYDFANSDGDPMDDNGHGSHVSGTIGGVANNGMGVAGLNWNVKIQAVKFLAANGSGSTWAGAQTILYAAKMKARVVNASWGCLGPGCYASYLEEAIKTLEQGGGIFIVAAGNNANNNNSYPAYPANYAVPSLVAVAATDSNDALASFSNYGATVVHVAAPGVGILSTVKGGGYASWNGTSMAAPHVAGAAALMVALRPDATPAEIKQKLIETCDPVAGLAGKVASGGRINARRLVASAGHAPAAPAGFDAVSGGHSDALLSWQPNTDSDLAGYRVRWGTASGQYTQSMDLAKTATAVRVAELLNGTRYFFVLHATSTSGLLSAPSAEKQVLATDGVAPAQVVDLAAAVIPGGEASGELVAASGEFSGVWAAKYAADGSPDTAWISAGRTTPEEESLTVGLFAPYLINGVDLLPSAAYPGFFPMDFDVEVSADSQSWMSVGGLRNATAAAGQHVQVLFPPTLASQVRLRVLRSRQHESGVYYAALAELVIFEASNAPNALRLSWSAAGDDPGMGRAARTDIRRSTSPLTTANFDGAVIVPAPGQPLAAGLREELTVSPLAGETTYHFALKSVDAAGNAAPMSNVAVATTLLIPPSTITDLALLESPADTHSGMITLGWTAPGGDGKEGQAVRYDLRMSDAPLTPGNFAGATAVMGVPAPGAAGTAERFALTDLVPGQTYYFAVRAIDAGGATGGVSNVVVAEPTDGDDVTPPARVGDLTAQFSNATVKLVATVDSVSDELSAARGAAKLIDGDVASAWQTKAAAATTPAWVVLDFGKVQPLVKFRANPSTADLIGSYPQDFEIQTSSDKVNWSSIVHVEGLLGKFGTWNEWAAPVTYARYARLYITRRGPASPAAAYAALGEFEAYALTPELDADLTWVAPGDDGYDGRAARYELRRSPAPLTDANFAGGQAVTTLAPLTGGMIEVLHLASLPSEATIYFALRAVDTTGNWSGVSNVAVLKTPGLPPAPISDLAVVGATKQSITLGFTATGDDGAVGTAAAYELRYATSPIGPATWAAATPAPAPAPRAPGTAEVITVAGLAPTTLYYFAIKAVDDVDNRSLLSNVAVGSTRDGTAPSAIRDLVATPVDPAQRPALALTVTSSSGSYTPETAAKYLLDGNDTTEWISPATAQMQTVSVQFDLGASRRLGRLRMRAGAADRDLFPVDFRLEVQATTGGAWTTAVSESAFATQGGWEEWALGSVSAVAARLVVTKTVLWTGKYMTAVADLELYEDPNDFSKLRLSWTATGDDAEGGVAAAYDLRRAATPVLDAGFAGAAPVAGVPTPQPAGYLERFEARDLAAESTHCFALKAVDEEGNASAISNTSCAT
ncbi:MAG: S8 family serine peptidase, partial [Verrucomicrobiota bacterium]